MKFSKILSIGTLVCLGAAGCTDLSEEVYTGVAAKDFFKTEEQMIANAGRAYTKLQGYNSEQSLWTLLLQASDECAVPAVGGEWYSNGRYEEIQTNRIPPANKLLTKGWNWCFTGIAACNEIIYETETTEIEFEAKDKILAEMRVLRAFFYYEAIANWGTVPFTVDYTDTDYPEPKDRRWVFNYIEKEILDNLDSLDAAPSATNYGRVTQAAANCILAKMYLNSEAWFNEPRYAEAEAVCKKIIDSGNYVIEDIYDTNFDVNNEISRENIFAIVYDRIYTNGDKRAFYLHILTLQSESQATFNIPAGPWSGFICEPDFFQLYDENDLRRDATWLYGEQKDINGQSLGFSYNPVFDENKYFNKNGGRDKFDGARCWKWHYQTDGSLTAYDISQDNDFAIFRYADVVLMYAEALMRQGNADKALMLPELQKIRTRAGLAPYATTAEFTLDELYNERGRELAWEGWRHEDMIRFGKYLNKYWAHEDQNGEQFRLLFPIPTDILNSNPKLSQNPGY